MSNVGSFLHHVSAQIHRAKTGTGDWFRRRSCGNKIANIFFSPLAFSVVLILLATYWNALMSVYVDQTNAKLNDPLPDRLHDLFGYRNDRPLANKCIMGMLVALVIRFLPIWNGMTIRRSTAILRRFLLLESIVQIARGFVMGATSLNPPDPNCQKVAFGSIWLDAFALIGGSKHTCGDLFFSGHTGVYTLWALFWSFYSQGEEFNIFLPRKMHARDCATQQGLDELTRASDGRGKDEEREQREARDRRIPAAERPLSPRAGRDSSASATGGAGGVGGANKAYDEKDRLGQHVSFSSASPFNWPPPRRSYHLIDFIVWAVQILAVLALIWVHYHYTGDTYVSFIFTQGLFRVYHLALENLERKLRMRFGYGIMNYKDPSCWVNRHDSPSQLASSDNIEALYFTRAEKFLLWFERAVLFQPEAASASGAGTVVLKQPPSGADTAAGIERMGGNGSNNGGEPTGVDLEAPAARSTGSPYGRGRQ